MSTTALLIASLLLPGQVSRTAPVRGDVADLSHCVISLIDDVQLPAQDEGVLQELIVKDNTIVTKDEVMGQIDTTDTEVRKRASQYRLDVANEKATNDAPVQVARKIIELAKAEYEESVSINRKSPGSIPDTQLRRQRVQWEKAVLDLVAADMEFKIAGLERRVSEAEVEAVDNELKRKTILAPFDGVVVQLFKKQSEWVKPGEPVVRLVRMDRLRIEGFLNADVYAPHEVLGADVDIIVDLEGEATQTLRAKIDFVSYLVEASGDYRVWAEVDNPPGPGNIRWLLRPGAEAAMRIYLKRNGVAAR